MKDLLFIDHGQKDPISKEIYKFKKYFNTKLNLIKLNKKKYILDLKKTYLSISLPFLTHDLVGRNFN